MPNEKKVRTIPFAKRCEFNFAHVPTLIRYMLANLIAGTKNYNSKRRKIFGH